VTDRGHTDEAARYVDRIAGYDQRLQMLERSHVHAPQVPVGGVIDWPAPVLPSDGTWRWADGAALAVGTYPDLFAVYGYVHGGAGASFNLPDYRSRVSVGTGQSPGLSNRVLGARGGAETVGLTLAQGPAHGHTINHATDNGGLVATGAAGPNTDNGGLVPTGNDSADHTHGGTTAGDSPTHQHSNAAGAGTGGNSGVGVFQSYQGASGPNQNAHAHGFTTGGRSAFHSHQGGAHAHTQPAHTHQGGAHAHSQSGTAVASGSGAAHENMPPWIAVGKIVRVWPDPARAASTAVLFVQERSV
jgi:microcystin-dependent protein